MSIDDKVQQITKKEFDQLLNDNYNNTQEKLMQYIQTYGNIILFKKEYDEAYKTNRIMHYIKNGILNYEVQEKRKIGFKKWNQQVTNNS